MSHRTLNILTIIICIGVGLLFLINARAYFVNDKPETFIAQDNVRGMAVSHKKKLYTLNFDQQKEAVRIFNLARPVVGSGAMGTKEKPEFEKIIIYLFNGENVEIIPLEWLDQSLVFSAGAWRRDGYLRDASNGQLYDLLKNSYDP